MHLKKGQMIAAILSAPGEVRLETVPAPEPGDGMVRVRLEGCGVCGSNLPPWEGCPWFQYPLAPGQPGHEGWGPIEAVGPGVNDLKPGDRVALLSYHAFAECDLARCDAVVRLPPELDGKPFPGEALGCAMNVLGRSDIYSGQTVAIIGIGFLGALLTQLAVRAGARVIAISRRPFALEIARACGAAETIAMDDHKRIVARVGELTGGRGCERVIEAVGQQWPLDLAGELTSERGRLIVAGYHQDGSRQINMQLWNWRGIDVINAHERDPVVSISGMREAACAVARGAIDLSLLCTHSFGLSQLGDAFRKMRDRPDGFLKALIRYE
jgi:threonine dehydrogenase-like Zn-dependent dehydrogenase